MEEVSDAPPPLCLRRVGCPSSINTIGDVFPLHLGTTTLGRSRTAAITQGQSEARHIYLDSVVSKCLISRQHARLHCWKDGDKGVCAKVSDLSVNGVFVNETKIGRPSDLRLGDVLTLGHRRGAALIAGTVATQSNSEFTFKPALGIGWNRHNQPVGAVE